MKKDTVLKVVSIILALVSILALICTVTVTGSGFLDLSNIVRGVCIGLCEGYLYSAYGLKGVCFHALIFLPGIFISSIAILLMTREAMKISNCFSSAMLTNSNASATSTSIKLYVIRSSCITIIILISSVIDLISSLMFSKFFSF